MEAPSPHGLSVENEKTFHRLQAAAAGPVQNLTQAQALIAELLAHQQVQLLANQQLYTSQQELATSEARLHAAETVAGIGSYELDLGSGLLHFSEGLCRLLGEVPDSFSPSIAWLDARSDPADAAAVQQVLNRAWHDQQPYHYTRRIRRADGQWRIFESHGRVVSDAAGAALRLEGVVEDKTAQRQAAQELREGRELLRATIDSSLNMVQVFEAVRDERGNIVDFTWLLNNQIAEQHYGDVIGQRLLARNPGVVETGIFDTFKRVVETGQPNQSERHYTSEQFNGWYHQSTVKLRDGVATTTADIGERKRHEQEILRLREEAARLAEDKYRTLFNSIDEGFCLFELLYDAHGAAVDYRFLEVNEVFELQTGLANAPGKRGSELVPGTESYWLETYAQVAQTGEPVRFESYHADTGRWYAAYAARVGGAGSRQVCAVFNDITERKHREERQGFLLQLSDVLRPLANALQIQAEAARLLGEHLGVDRVYYVELHEAAGYTRVSQNYLRGDSPSLAGTYALSDYDWALPLLLRDEPVIVEDAETSGLMPDMAREQMRTVASRAHVTMPLVKNGQLIGSLCVTEAVPRKWAAPEVALIRETAERIWGAIARARVEAALRESEEKYRTLFDSMDEGYCLIEVILDDHGRPVDVLHLEVNQAHQRQSGISNLVGRRLLELMPEVEPEWLAFYGGVALTGQPARLEYHVAALGRWFTSRAARVGGEGSLRVAIIFDDITERKKATQILEESAARQAFLLRFSDAIRSLASPLDIQRVGMRLLGEHLGATRAFFFRTEPVADGDWLHHIESDYRRDPNLPSYAGRHSIRSVGLALFEEASRGEVVAVEDVTKVALLTPAEMQHYLAVQVVAFINVPLLKDGKLVAGIGAHDAQPRPWLPAEIALMQEVADRTWAALERARAEAALRENEAKYRVLFDSIDEGFCLIEVLLDARGAAVDYRFLEVNEVFERQTGLANAPGQLGSNLAPNTEPYWLATYAQVAHTGEPVRFENYHEGTGRWYSAYASRVDGGSSHQVCIVFDDITERKQQQARQQLLMLLSDELRPLAGAVAMQEAATRVARSFFGASRCYYGEIAAGQCLIRRDAAAAGLPSVAGLYDLATMPLFSSVLEAGHPLVVEDVRTTDLVDEGLRQLCVQLEVISYLHVPVSRHGQAVGVLCVVQGTPRRWTPPEVALVVEIAERIWAAVERAKIEEALHASEAQLRSFITASSDTLYRMDTDWQHMSSLQGRNFMSPTSAPSENWLMRYILPADQPAVLAAVRAAVEDQRFFELEHRVFRADGSVGWTFSRAVPVLGPQGELVEWFGTATDITARKQA